MMQESQALSISQEGTVCDHQLVATSTMCPQVGMKTRKPTSSMQQPAQKVQTTCITAGSFDTSQPCGSCFVVFVWWPTTLRRTE